MLGIPTARTIRCFHPRVPSPQKSRRLLLIKPVELLLFSTGADMSELLKLLATILENTCHSS
jgi:hypothetical protein